MEDPFTRYYESMPEDLQQAQAALRSFSRIQSTALSSSSPELAEARADLEVKLKELSEDLQDLELTVESVAKDPFQFGLDIDEVGQRKSFVDQVGGKIKNLNQQASRILAGGQGKTQNTDLPDPGAFEADEDDYAAMEQQRQVEIMQEQDEALDDVFKTVGNLREQAGVMGMELEEQGGMLEEVDHLADRVGGKLQGGMQKLNTIIRKNEDKMSSCCIGVLILVLVILLILVIAL